MSKNGSSAKAGKGIANGCSVQIYRVGGAGVVSCGRNCVPYVAPEEAACPSKD